MNTMPKDSLRQLTDDAFKRLCEVWDVGLADAKKGVGFLVKDYWKAGNTLDAAINYMVVTNTSDEKGRIQDSYEYIYSKALYPAHWRDDYGWWGNAFVNACRPAHAKILGLNTTQVKTYLEAAEACWDVLRESADENQKYYDDCEDEELKRNLPSYGGGYATWNKNSVADYIKNRTLDRVPNTVTNVGYWALTIGLYELTKDVKYLQPMAQTFLWFNKMKTWLHLTESMLLNKNNLIRETVNPWDHTQKWCYDTSRAWTADQGTFLYCLWKSMKYNFNDNYCTGPGVLIRYVSLIEDKYVQGLFVETIKNSAINAWEYRDKDPQQPQEITNQILCWYAPIRDTQYKDRFLKDNDGDNAPIWYFALQASGLDVLVAALRVSERSEIIGAEAEASA
jgi:hypothetical protein